MRGRSRPLFNAAASVRRRLGPVAVGTLLLHLAAMPIGTVLAADTSAPDTAQICLTETGVTLPPGAVVTLPASSVFEDQGPLKGQVSDPSSWSYDLLGKSMPNAAFETQAPAELRQSQRCTDVRVKMVMGSRYGTRSASAQAKHVFILADVLDYPLPAARPVIELGKLIDDISVRAILLSDVESVAPPEPPLPDNKARSAACRQGAERLAAHVHGAVGRQTDVVVFLGGLPVSDASYGCPFARSNADLTVSWDHTAEPQRATLALIGDAGAFLTGGAAADIQAEAKACVAQALTPDAGELASREERGIRFECQAFERDGGAGTITIYRRFGKNPDRAEITSADAEALQHASAAFAAEEEQRAARSLAFAKWYQDPAIPQSIKTFVMMAARVQSLAERCPSAPSFKTKVEQWAEQANVSPSDTQPGGRYADLMTSMLAAMRNQATAESKQEACAAAQRYF